MASQQNCANQCIDKASKSEKKKQRDRTSGKQLKGFRLNSRADWSWQVNLSKCRKILNSRALSVGLGIH